MQAKLVVLDRDGVINRDSRDFIKSVSEWVPLEGSMPAIGLLSQAGYTVAVASNQSGLGRGLFTRAALYRMHRKMRRLAARDGGTIDRIVYCPHRPGDGCDCRKPLPGLLRQLERHYRVSMRGIPVVGDSARDLQAARELGARPVLVRTGNGARTERSLLSRGESVETYDDLLHFATSLVGAGKHLAI
jgi:D-glycero-D-manno-heptose 1,7-bisphosphate phosphatase